MRGREPEFSLLSDIHNIRIIGYMKRGKMHESGVVVSRKLEIVCPKIKPIFFIDPIYAMRNDYECSSWIQFEGLEEYLKDRDVVITHELWNCLSYQSVKICKQLGIPLIAVVFETIPRNLVFTFTPPYSRNTKFVAENADLFVAQTNKAKLYLRSLGLEEKRLRVVYPGIDLELFKPSSKKKNREDITILFVGNFIQKGLSMLIKAFLRLFQEYRSASLSIIGNGPEEMIYELKLLEKKFPIRLLGTVPHNNMAEIYRNADIFCVLSKDTRRFGIKVNEEQFGYAIVEAMASGLPIVTTDCGAIPEIVGPQNSVVKQNSSGEVINALEILLKDRKLREAIGRDNRKRAETMFNATKQSAILMSQISSMLS